MPDEESSARKGESTTAVSALPARERAILCARIAADNRAKDVLVLDMTEIVRWVDYLVVATGASGRQIRSIADGIETAMKDLGDRKLGLEGYEHGEWVVVDFADVVVHLFTPEKRAYYELEHLWGDAKVVPWQRTGDGGESE